MMWMVRADMVRCRGLMVWNGCVADWPISMEFFRGVVDGGLFFEVLVWFNGADCRPGVLVQAFGVILWCLMEGMSVSLDCAISALWFSDAVR